MPPLWIFIVTQAGKEQTAILHKTLTWPSEFNAHPCLDKFRTNQEMHISFTRTVHMRGGGGILFAAIGPCL